MEPPWFPTSDEGSSTSPSDHFESGNYQCSISFSEFEHQDDIMPSIISEHRPWDKCWFLAAGSLFEFSGNRHITITRSIICCRDQSLHEKKFKSEPNNLPPPRGNQVESKMITESEAKISRNRNTSCTTISFEKNHEVF